MTTHHVDLTATAASACRSLKLVGCVMLAAWLWLAGPAWADPPTINSLAPAAATNCPGSTAQFTVDATGADWYFWYHVPFDLSATNLVAHGQTLSTLTLNNVQPANSGYYAVVVTNIDGTATSLPPAPGPAILVVGDFEAPVITGCPANITDVADAGQCSKANVTWTAPTANDNCDGPVSVTCAPPSGSTFNVGVTTVVCSALDSAGNSNACVFTVTIQDTQPPVIGACPSNVTTPADPGSTKAKVTWTNPTATDNCPGVTVTCVPPSGTRFPQGTTVVTCTATDGAGLTDQCTFTVTVGAPRPANIVWVSDNPGMTGSVTGFTNALAGTVDDQFVTLLQNAGHNVIRFSSDNSQNVLLTQEYIDALNTNDLIILGRSVGSGAFQSPQGDQWSTAITKPVLCQNAYLARWSRLGWFTGTDTVPDGTPMPLTVANPTDPANAYLFAGVALVGGTMVEPYDLAMGRNTSHIYPTNLPVAGSRVLATGLDTNGQTVNVIVEFPAGTVVKGTNTLAGYRLYFACGYREPSGGAVADAGGNNLTTAGQDIFLRAVNLALNEGVPPNLGDPPVITTQPASVSECAGRTVSLSVVATGQDPLFYQWFKDGEAVSGGTSATLVIANLQPANVGTYTVVVSNAVGAVTSDPATVSIMGEGTVATPLSNVANACPGTQVSFSTTPTAGAPWTFTWTKDGVVIPGETNNSLIIPSVSAADAGTYCVIVQGICDAVTNCATLTVAGPPVITAQPQNQSTPMGNGTVFTVGVSSPVPVAYQWQTNGVDVDGATGSSFAISNLSLAMDGTKVRVRVSNCAGTVTSAEATLTVTPVSGISFDFDTPGQFTNVPYCMVHNDWLSGPNFNTPPLVFESPVGGTGPFPGSGALDLSPNNGTVQSLILLPVAFDFSLPGKTLSASTMVKIKTPTSNNRNTQIGFCTSTNGDLDNSAGRVYMSVILQSMQQPALTYSLRTGNKPTAANSFQEGNATANFTLTVSNWYRLTATFSNAPSAVPGTYRVSAKLEDLGPQGLSAPTTVASISPVTVTNVDIASARYVYFVLRGIENTGVDLRDNVYVYTTPGELFFVQQPLSQTVLQGRRAIFKAYVDGEGPYKYQWQRSDDDGNTWTNIEGAGNWKYMLVTQLKDNGAKFRVVVTGPSNTITSDWASLTVQADALTVVGAGSVDGTTVGVEFNQPVDPESASNPANYLINGSPAVAARLYLTGLGPMGLDGIYVVLTPPEVLTSDFTLVVNGVKDLSGNSIGPNSTTGWFAGLTGVDINTLTAPAGEHYCFGRGKFIIKGGGADIWGVADQTHYVYTKKRGDFDVVMKVPYLDVVRSPSKAGFHVRNSLDPFDKVVTAAVNPMWPGRNYPEGSTRQTNAAVSTSWGSTPTYNLAWYPNAWLRFRRAGNVFLRYSSTNGINWNLDGQTSAGAAAWTWMVPEEVYLGLVVCSVANNNMCNAQFENVGDFAGYPGATITISRQPTNAVTIAAGSSAVNNLVASVSGGGIPALGELCCLWQRYDPVSASWTNLVMAGATNQTVTIGPLYITDNGAQFRCVLRAPGAAEVISDPFTVTVTDTTGPTFTAAGLEPLNAYPIDQVVLTFSEPLSEATATDPANYTVTNAAGTVLPVVSAQFLSGDPRVVVLKVDGLLGAGTCGVTVSGLRDLNGNLITGTLTRSFRSFAPPTAPVVVELYQDIGGGNALQQLMVTNLFTNMQPTLIVFSNLFGYNVSLSGLTAPTYPPTGTTAIEQYGVRAYTYFVPPSDGYYKFWIRSDDAMVLWLNTNGITPLRRNVVTPVSSPFNPHEAAQFAFDCNPATKYGGAVTSGLGLIVSLADGPAVVTGIRFRAANDARPRDPKTFTLEGSASGPGGPWTTIVADANAGMDTDPGRYMLGQIVTFANDTPYAHYRLTINSNQGATDGTQFSEVELLDANNKNVANPDIVCVALATAYATSYTNAVPASLVTALTTNVYLRAGRPYYMEFLGKEGTGGDGFSVMWTAPNAGAPANTSFISPANLAFPEVADPQVKAITELYIGYQNFLTGYNQLAGLTQATNFPADNYLINTPAYKYIAGMPDIVGYQNYFATQPVLYDTRYHNYLGRMMTYFVAPSNGLYKFYMRSDDSSQLYMNTNAVNSTDPAGMVLLGRLDAYTSAYTLVAQNVPLIGGQKYFMQVLWREGTGGDGVAVAVRSQGDPTTPPISPKVEVIPGNLLELPVPLIRAGPVQFDYIASSGPQTPDKLETTVVDGRSLVLCAVGLRGTMPYGFTWLKNGQLMWLNSFTNNWAVPFTLADDGCVITLIVTNHFSRCERSITVHVLPDGEGPTVVRTIGWPHNDGFTIEFSEPVDALSATYLGNYQISPPLALLSAQLDRSGTRVSFATAPQAPDTTYVITINNVKDASSAGNLIAPNTTTSFSTWSVGGSGLFLVEIWTNILGSSIADLTGAPKFQQNQPDCIWYTNVFGIGTYGANSGLENYGGRVSGLFVPTNTGFYRFYLRSDDASQFWMNPNGPDPAGRVMLIHVYGANISMGHWTAISQPVPLVAGQRYYVEALMKEGTGGDYVLVAFRECDANGNAYEGTPADAATSIASGVFFDGVPGTADFLQVVEPPPSDVYAVEGDPVSLSMNVYVSPAYKGPVAYQWQKETAVGSGEYTNVPGATLTNYTFICRLADDGLRFRVVVSLPTGHARTAVATLHVTPDTSPPEILSCNSLDGKSLVIRYKRAVDIETARDPLNYRLNGEDMYASMGQPVDDRTVFFALDVWSYLTNEFFHIEGTVLSGATQPVEGQVSGDGHVELLTPQDIGTPGVDPIYVGSTFTWTNGCFSMKGGGSDVWGTADGMHMAYRWVTGDFDVKVRVESLVGPNTWTKAGLMVRGSTAAGSRFIDMLVTPPAYNVPAGQNRYAFQWRDADGASASWASEAAVSPPYPNAWVRLQRRGSVINAYRSDNGLDWVFYGSRDTAAYSGGAYPDTVMVGLFVTAHDNSGTVFGQAEFRDLYFPWPPTIDVQPGPTPQVVGIHQTVTFGGMVVSGTGPLTYQWRKDGVPIPGATSDSLTITDTKVVDSGVYTVLVGNDGGAVVSADCVLVVTNLPPVTVGETNVLVQGNWLTVSTADLLANDSDPEGDPLSIIAVSGLPPVSWSANFDDGQVPAGAAIYSAAGGGYIATTDGVNGTGCLKLTDAVGSQAGSFILPELTPGKRVSAFTASFKLRIGNASSEPADGFSFNFANDLPLTASTSYGENGAGTGLSFCVDNYRFVPLAIGNPANSPGGGTANTSGLKVNYNNQIIAGVQIPTWNVARWVPVSITLTPEGVLTVYVDGTNVFGNLVLPGYTPKPGRFGLYARTGGQYETHWVDDLSVTVLTADTARDYALGGSRYGTAYIFPTGGVGNSGCLHLTDNVNNQMGALILDSLTPGSAVAAFEASFKLRIGDGSANAADGFSFNLAADLPEPPPYAAYEEGAGTGLSLCVDNYPTGGTDAPSFKLKYGGALLGYILIPKWNSPNWVPINITLTPGGLLTVNVDGTNVVENLPIPYTPIAGRFGLFARTGGENQTHWVDDLVITALSTEGYPGYYAQDFDSGGPGSVSMSGGMVTYVPPPNACGTDAFYYIVSDGPSAGVATYVPPPNACGTDVFYYLVSDGQVNGTVMTEKVVVINEAAPAAPTIVNCAPDLLLQADANNELAVPDLTKAIRATDNCCCVSVTQDPAPGTLVGPGQTVVTFTVTDSVGLQATCQATLTVNGQPVANPDNLAVVRNTPLTVPAAQLLANDTDPDGDTLTVTAVGPSPTPSGGTVELVGTDITYTPPTDYEGADTFTYTISDGKGGSAQAQVYVAINKANLAFPQPDGGWLYVYTGELNCGAPRRANQPALDCTWYHENGSDEWDGDGRGPGNGPPGGVESVNGILTIEDAVTSTSGQNNNRKLYFEHGLIQDGVTAKNILDTGVTLCFRTRLTPPDGKNEIPLPDGYGVFSDGKGMFVIRQSSPGAAIAFSLVRQTEDLNPTTTLEFPAAGLIMNKNNGDTPSNQVDCNEVGGVTNLLAIDPTQWHEFWITIQANDDTPGNGTHTVKIYVDGSTTPYEFNVTAGTGSDVDQFMTSWTDFLAMGLNNSPTVGAYDIDFFAYKPGVVAPTPFNQPVSIAQQPVSQTVTQGNVVTLSVVAAGTPPFSYQWYSNGVAIAGATSASYSFVAQCPEAVAAYTVEVGNFWGPSVLSEPAVVTIVDAPPVLAIAKVGSDVVISWTKPTCATWQLEQTDELPVTGAPTWTAVTETPVEVDGRLQVTIAIGSGNKFFRLHKQP